MGNTKNILFWMPLNFINGQTETLNINTLRSRENVKLMFKCIQRKIMRRILITLLPILFFMPGFIFLLSGANNKPQFHSFLLKATPFFIFLISLSLFILITSILTSKFIKEIYKDSNCDAIIYRFLLQKKRSLIYAAIFLFSFDVYLCNGDHFLYMALCQLLATVFIYIPLHHIQSNLNIITGNKYTLSVFNIINPQYLNRFRGIKNEA